MTTLRNSTAGAMLAAGVLSLASAVSAQSHDGYTPGLVPMPTPAPSLTQDDVPAAPTRPASALTPVVVPIHTAPADMGQGYGIWAAADSYKVSFHAGMTFVPYLGANYPHNQVLAWRTTSAKVGGVELIEPSVPATHSHGAYRYEYRFGAITEAYDVRADGLEQTFVLTQRPAAGDLVIQGAVTSQLRAVAAKVAQQSLVFADADGHALVEYGRAIAIDGNGDQVAVGTGYADGVVSLVVPGAWLANAALPIVVDPLLTRVSVATAGFASFGQVESLDIARDDYGTSSNVLVAYTRAASATDFDAYARLVNDDFSGTTTVFTDVTTSWSTDQIACAFVGGSTKWASVFRRHFLINSPITSQIRCHVSLTGDTTLQTNYGSLVPPTQNNDWRPDVGGVDAFAAGDDACVVFQREDNAVSSGAFANTSESVAMAVLLDTTTANGTFGTPFVAYTFTSSDVERPSVNKVAEGGTNFSWVCVQQVYNNSITNDDWDLIGRRIGNDGSVAAGAWVSDFALQGTDHQLGPVVEGQDGRYAVFFSTTDLVGTPFKTTLIAGKSLYVERFDWAHGVASPTGDKAPKFVRGNSDRRWEATGLAYDTNDESHFMLGYRAVSPGVPVAYASRVGFNGALTEGPSVILYSVSGDVPSPVACVFDNDSNTAQYAYSVDDGSAASQPVYGQGYTYDAATPWSVSGNGCSATQIAWLGNQQIGSEFGGAYVYNSSASAAHFLLVSLASSNALIIHPAVLPNCSLLVDAQSANYLGTMPLHIGASSQWAFALPEWLGPLTLYFQDWVLEGTTLTSTQRLTVPFVK